MCRRLCALCTLHFASLSAVPRQSSRLGIPKCTSSTLNLAHKAIQTHLNFQHVLSPSHLFAFYRHASKNICLKATKIIAWFLFLCHTIGHSSLMAAVAVTQSDFVFVHDCQRTSRLDAAGQMFHYPVSGVSVAISNFQLFHSSSLQAKNAASLTKKLSQVRICFKK